MSTEQPLPFYQWLDNGDLMLDVEILTVEGTSTQRVTIPRATLSHIISDDMEGARFFMRDVMGLLRSRTNVSGNVLQGVQNVRKQMQSPSSPFNRQTSADALLGPQLLELEKTLRGGARTATVRGSMLPVGAQGG